MKETAVFQSISDVATSLNVPAHVLRFWETQFVQIKPVRRVGGRRYYRAQDVALLRCIYDLLYKKGYTISGAQKYLKENAHASDTVNTVNSKQQFIEEIRSIKKFLKDFIA